MSTATSKAASGRRISAHSSKPAPPQAASTLAAMVHMLTCGSVDDGKSTLIGRLLWDAADITEDQREMLSRSGAPDGIPDFSLLVDGLLAEREQGITIDIAWRYVDAGRRRLVIIDSPGHEQYTRNMASGASHADVAVMLVDARHGIKPQTCRHAAILDLVGVRHVVLAVNKMDLADWSETRFRRIEADFKTLAWRFGFHDARAIPLSAKRGDNVAWRSAQMPWYQGPTLLDRLNDVPARASGSTGPFRFPVQMVLRAGDFRGLAGTVASGRIAVGDRIVDAASGRQALVARIATMDGDLDVAGSGQAVVLVLDADLDISRGAMLATPGKEPRLGRGLQTRFVWLADARFEPGQSLLLRSRTDLVPVESLKITARLDLASLAQTADNVCNTNDLVIADIVLGRPAALDAFAEVAATGAFVLVDRLSGATVAGGVVRSVSRGESQSRNRGFRLTRELLASGVCAGLAPEHPEFHRRAEEVARLLEAAGVKVSLAHLPRALR